jgi:hypothetical protein
MKIFDKRKKEKTRERLGEERRKQEETPRENIRRG